MIEQILPIMVKLSNGLSALKKCRILHFEKLTSNKQKFGFQVCNEYSAD